MGSPTTSDAIRSITNWGMSLPRANRGSREEERPRNSVR